VADCPFCSEPVLELAKKCPHCGETLVARPAPRAPRTGTGKALMIFLGVLVVCATPCLAAVLIPSMVSARKPGNEAAAIGALKTLATAQARFREGDLDADGTLDYATLAELSDATLIDAVLASGAKQGYLFQVQPSPRTPGLLWMAVASPATPGASGDRYFFTNQTGIIYYSVTAPFALDPDASTPTDALPIGR
jgi:type IV pilus assembly protein PilA